MGERIRANASWDTDAWLVALSDADGVVGQAKRLGDAQDVARRLWSGAHPDVSPEEVADLEVELSTTLPAGMAESLARAEELRAEAHAKQNLAGALVRQTTQDLCAIGLTRTDIAVLLGVSQQRVSQLLAADDGDPVQDTA